MIKDPEHNHCFVGVFEGYHRLAAVQSSRGAEGGTWRLTGDTSGTVSQSEFSNHSEHVALQIRGNPSLLPGKTPCCNFLFRFLCGYRLHPVISVMASRLSQLGAMGHTDFYTKRARD